MSKEDTDCFNGFEETETVILSQAAYDRLVYFLENPPALSDKLKEAAKKYRDTVDRK